MRSADSDKPTTGGLRPCPICGEVFRGQHDCDAAREARALFEAAKRANSRESGLALADRAYDVAVAAERVQ